MKTTPRPNERGLALALALFTLAVTMLVAAGGFLVGSADIRATRNYRGASQAHYVAESAILQATQVTNQTGVLNFQNEVVTVWGTLFGTGPRAFAPLPGYSYTVSAVVDALDPMNAGRFVAIATGPENVRNTVVARVSRSNIPAVTPGAVYLAQDNPTNATFSGNAFMIDGRDHNYTGGMGPAPPVPGLTTRNDTNTQETMGSLSAIQKDNVMGLGYYAGPPIVPSVMTSSWAPSVAQLNQIAQDLINLPTTHVLGGGNLNGNTTFGTSGAPWVTYFNGDVRANGNATGAGIMIIEGDLTIQGNFSFTGLVIVRGRTHVTGTADLTGNATLYGSLWTNDVDLDVAGSSIVYYSSQALQVANLAGGGGALPAPVQLISLADCAVAASGPATGCP